MCKKVRCGHISGRFSYPGIMEAAYGKFGYYLLSSLQFMYPFLGKHSLELAIKTYIRFGFLLESGIIVCSSNFYIILIKNYILGLDITLN